MNKYQRLSVVILLALFVFGPGLGLIMSFQSNQNGEPTTGFYLLMFGGILSSVVLAVIGAVVNNQDKQRKTSNSPLPHLNRDHQSSSSDNSYVHSSSSEDGFVSQDEIAREDDKWRELRDRWKEQEKKEKDNKIGRTIL